MAKRHSRLSPSSASRWIGCPGSVQRVEKLIRQGKYVERRSSPFAAEGTAAHQIREDCLRFGFDPEDFIGVKQGADGQVFEVTSEMADFLREGIDRILTFDGDLLVEVHLDTTPWVGKDTTDIVDPLDEEQGHDQGGTGDAIIIDWDQKIIAISDLKYGTGIPVQAVGNKQLRVYLLALITMLENQYGKIFNDWEFLIIIDQPRHSRGGGEWSQTYDELMAFGEEVREAARLTKAKNPPIRPSNDACMWCAAAKIDGACPEFEKSNLDLLGLEFEDLDKPLDEPIELPDIEGISPSRRAFILHNWPRIKKWGERLHANAIQDAMDGKPNGDLKAVWGGKRIRSHADEDLSYMFMRSRGLPDAECYKQELISPAQAEKKLRLGTKKFPQHLIKETPLKPVLVPVDDARPAIPIDSDYENLEDSSDDDI